MAAACRWCVCSFGRNNAFLSGSHKTVSVTSRAPICTSVGTSGKDRRWDSDFSSLENKGFLRPAKEYHPPLNVREIIINICARFLRVKNVTVDSDAGLGDATVRFKILTSCIERLKHDIPNSELHKLTTVGDLVSFYEQSVETRNPYDILCSRMTNQPDALPPNLHLQADYVRFHPETDTAFGGVSAFPGRSTEVTGLKYKKKYRGFKDETLWPNE